MKHYDSYTASPRHPDRIREALRTRLLEPFDDPAEQLEAISVGPRSLWYHYADENDLRDMQGGAVASHIIDVAEILRDFAGECAPDAVHGAPNLDELSIRLSRTGGICRSIENALSWRGYGAYSNTCSLKDLGIDTSRLPRWGEGPIGIDFPTVFSWDAESMLAHGRADGDRIFRIYPRNAEWLERLGGRSVIDIIELPGYLWRVRQWRGLSQAAAGAEIGVSGSYVGQLERAERWPSVYALEDLATWLDARVEVSPVATAGTDRSE